MFPTQQLRREQIETLYNARITKGIDISKRTNIPKQSVSRVLALIKDQNPFSTRKELVGRLKSSQMTKEGLHQYLKAIRGPHDVQFYPD